MIKLTTTTKTVIISVFDSLRNSVEDSVLDYVELSVEDAVWYSVDYALGSLYD